MDKLPTEILTMIAAISSQNKIELLDLWKERMSLSVESFASAPPVQDYSHIGQFRLVCRSFSKAGVSHQFMRIQIRFSPEGFRKLEQFMAFGDITYYKAVKQFSYMIPPLYSKERAQFEAILRDFDSQLNATMDSNEGQAPLTLHQQRIAAHYRGQVAKAMAKADAQRHMIREGSDKTALLSAFTAFTSLRQIRLMRVTDEDDRGWAIFLRNNPTYADEGTASEWSSASEHAISTIFAAAKQTGSPFNRLSSRFIDPSMPLVLTSTLNSQITSVARKLISIELQLIEHADPDEKITALSPIFEVAFRAAIGLDSFHIGSNYQISVPLSLVFHGIHFKNLKHIGLHLWQLDHEELLEMLAQHQGTLRSLRLRRINLRQASPGDLNWKKVLHYVRSHLTLNWISLRMIRYEGEDQIGGMLPLAPLQGLRNFDSDSDLEDPNDWSDSNSGLEKEDDDHEDDHADSDMAPSPDSIHDSADDEASTEAHESSEASEDEVEDDEGHHSDLDDEHHGDFQAGNAILPCHCNDWPESYSWGDLDDNGVSISPKKWKKWEKWSIYRCRLHDPPQ
ncbi:uncharacterized protein L3040_005141 [Drepanopeziza brunnea f. sp. 'multigermtubi']|uniref:uncharacterized protein n=1 Tax=Drepanopeziza brunnea f. sp. 'multigermtubi' TaxID=698441 RepID=UPI00238B2466|nr:hypothetical protein L3040_005141 [Drepanopeziza brunnea f. sp. 'multigermtubi']